MFVTSSDFNLPSFQLANVTQLDAALTSFITKMEKKYLKQLLGVTMYTEFIAYLATVPAWKSTTTFATDEKCSSGNNTYKSLQDDNSDHEVTDGAWWELVTEDDKWLLLQNGSTYELVGCPDRDFEWVGLSVALKPLIYSLWVEDGADYDTGVGRAEEKSENAETVSPRAAVIKGWNEAEFLFGEHSCDYFNTMHGFIHSIGSVEFPNYYPDFLGDKNFLDL